MKIHFGKQILPLGMVLVLVLLSGCVTYPIAKNIQKQAKPLTLAQAVANPGAHQGAVVIWGGRIIKTVNDVNSSAIYILQLPLDRSGKPMVEANTSGRFIASSKGFLDPEIYKRGRLITVAGAFTGLETQPVQKTQYTYPVVEIKQIHLWPVERRHGYYYYPAWGYYYPGWYLGWYPAWGWGWYYHGGHWGGGYHYNGGGNSHYQDNGSQGGAYHTGGSQGGSHWQGNH
ncbi:MAG TPA: Slp family lipoprotein [Candidatus Saccharimonadales bacterium]|nr:Slp family lipoprotein [Candidatus Saccharimonadales bacterium]